MPLLVIPFLSFPLFSVQVAGKEASCCSYCFGWTRTSPPSSLLRLPTPSSYPGDEVYGAGTAVLERLQDPAEENQGVAPPGLRPSPPLLTTSLPPGRKVLDDVLDTHLQGQPPILPVLPSK